MNLHWNVKCKQSQHKACITCTCITNNTPLNQHFINFFQAKALSLTNLCFMSSPHASWSIGESCLTSHPPHLSLNRGGRWVTTDDFTSSFLHFSLFPTALWDLPNSRPVHSLMLSSHFFFRLSCLLPPFTVPCKMVLARPDERETWPYHCSLRLFAIVNH